jgi:hypothetical protein
MSELIYNIDPAIVFYLVILIIVSIVVHFAVKWHVPDREYNEWLKQQKREARKLKKTAEASQV